MASKSKFSSRGDLKKVLYKKQKGVDRNRALKDHALKTQKSTAWPRPMTKMAEQNG